MKVHTITPEHADYNDFSMSGPHFFKDSMLRVQLYNDSITLTDLTEAMKAGKKCLEVKFRAPWNSNKCEVANLLRTCNYHFPTLFKLLADLGTPNHQTAYQVQVGDITGEAWVLVVEAKRTYSPFASLNPLKEAPAKWTIPHVVRALLNGQFEELRCVGKYSDDYFYDNQINFGKGAISAQHLAEELIESPSGWWTSAEGNSISICCHHFDSNRFTFTTAAPSINEQIRRFLVEQPQIKAQWLPNGNALLEAQHPVHAAALEALYAALRQQGVSVEFDTEELTTYLAIYQTALMSSAA